MYFTFSNHTEAEMIKSVVEMFGGFRWYTEDDNGIECDLNVDTVYNKDMIRERVQRLCVDIDVWW